MEKELKKIVKKLVIAIEITIWIFIFIYIILSKSEFTEPIMTVLLRTDITVLIIILSVAILHLLVYEIHFIVKLVRKRKA